MTSRRKIFAGLGIVLGLAVLFYVMGHSRSDGALEAYKRQLRARGEKLTIAELTPPTPTNRPNAAPALMNVASQLQLTTSNWVPVATLMSPGHLRASWQQEILPTEDTTNVWPRLEKDLEGKREALSQARAALTNPVFSLSLNYQQGFKLFLPHLSPLKQTAICLSAATIFALHQNRPDEAWENLKASANLTRLFGRDEPLMICQLVRIAISQIALSAAWEALQYPGWSEQQLAELQSAWDSFDLLDEMEPALSMERAMAPITFEEIRNSFTNWQSLNTSPAIFGSGQSSSLQIFENWAWKTHWSYEEELYTMQTGQEGLEAVRLAKTNHAFTPALKQLDKNLTELQNRYSNEITHFIASDGGSYLPRFLEKVTNMEMERRLLVTAIALKRYQLQNGKSPEQLAALIPDFLREAPMDVLDGKLLRYRLNPDATFLLYSVGEDGVDDGGDPSPVEAESPPGVSWQSATINLDRRFKNWWLARDAVWPMPATPEEIKAYQDKLITERESKEAREQSLRSFGRSPPPSNVKTN